MLRELVQLADEQEPAGQRRSRRRASLPADHREREAGLARYNAAIKGLQNKVAAAILDLARPEKLSLFSWTEQHIMTTLGNSNSWAGAGLVHGNGSAASGAHTHETPCTPLPAVHTVNRQLVHMNQAVAVVNSYTRLQRCTSQAYCHAARSLIMFHRHTRSQATSSACRPSAPTNGPRARRQTAASTCPPGSWRHLWLTQCCGTRRTRPRGSTWRPIHFWGPGRSTSGLLTARWPM